MFIVIKMDLVKDSHKAIFSGQTKCGKTHLLLNLLESEYKHHFDYIIIICHTIGINKTYLERPWICKDNCVFLIKPGYKSEDKSDGQVAFVDQRLI